MSEPGAEMLVRVSSAEANRLGMTPEQVGDAVSDCLLDARPACGVLALDETRDCLIIR